MIKKIIFAVCLTVAFFGFSAIAQDKTLVNNAKAKTMLLGEHKFSLQWISWDYFGTASVTDENGIYYLRGTQNGRGEAIEDYSTIEGVITSIDAKEFAFSGKIIMRISHINNGEPCERVGDYTFKITGKRKYWRLQQMDNPCEAVADYVDIYFR